MIISANKIIGSLVYRTRNALQGKNLFMQHLREYAYSESCISDGKLKFIHFPGTHQEIADNLLRLAPAQLGGNNRFPALFNFNTIHQRRDGDSITVYYNLAFVAPVHSDWITERREVEVFEKILRPLYEEFMVQLKKSGYFFLGYGKYPPHDYYEVFTTDKNGGELIDRYGDNIDAIEVHNLVLTLEDLCDEQLEIIEKENNLLTM